MPLASLIMDSDSYKFSHAAQYPPGTTGMFSYLESRGGRYNRTVFFGLQMILKMLGLDKPVTGDDVKEARSFAKAHGVPFNEEGWGKVVSKHRGFLPVRIRAVREGTVVPTHNVLMTCESLDVDLFWLVSYIETALMRTWYPCTVATQSWHIRQIILEYLHATSDDPDAEIDFKLHDFGARGVSSRESAMIGGAAHLVNFRGSDTVAGVWAANTYYKEPMAGVSIPAMEHSTVTSWGKEREADAFSNMLDKFGGQGKLIACVSDSYDIYKACAEIWGKKLKRKVIESGTTVIVRPDSGHPAEVVTKCLQILNDAFGSSRTKQGFKVLNNVRVIQGDGINEDSIREILESAKKAGFSATNIAFGMGGALLQKVDRDTQKFAYKCSEVTVNGKSVPVSKDPITDPGKRSKAGRVDLVFRNGKFETVVGDHEFGSMLETVYENGEIKREQTLADVRARAKL